MKFTYTYKSLRGQVSREIEIDETEQAKTFPEVIKVDGEVYTQQNQLDRYGYTWQATAGGIRVFFRSDSGKDFSIMRELLRKKNLWKDEVAELIKSTGKTMAEVSELTEVPYRTLQHWKGGDREPSNMVKKAFRTAVKGILNDELKVDRYSYQTLVNAYKRTQSQEALNAIGEWFERYGRDFWTGEFFTDELGDIYPVCEEDEDGNFEIVGYEIK